MGKGMGMKIIIGVPRCPFCGSEAYARIGMYGVHCFYCTSKECGACVSFLGEQKLPSGIGEAVDPVGNWANRAEVVTVDKKIAR